MTKEMQALRQPMIDRVDRVVFQNYGLGFRAVIEQEFDIDISDDEWAQVFTSSDLYNLVEAHLDANQAADNEANPARK